MICHNLFVDVLHSGLFEKYKNQKYTQFSH